MFFCDTACSREIFSICNSRHGPTVLILPVSGPVHGQGNQCSQVLGVLGTDAERTQECL